METFLIAWLSIVTYLFVGIYCSFRFSELNRKAKPEKLRRIIFAWPYYALFGVDND